MPTADILIESQISTSVRARQLCSMFDVPANDKCRIERHINLPIETRDWNIGLIVGPSGAGKTMLLKHMFGEPLKFDWRSPSVVDDFDKSIAIGDITAACQAVGFNTIPAWLRPFGVLSNGEQFRVMIARMLLESKNEIMVLDEFTSVVDRQVAQIASNSVQKYIRKNNQKLVVASCHFDIIDWLQPDWIYNPATDEFQWRSLRRRPEINITISPVSYDAWKIFAPFHYLTADLNKAARCWGLFVDEQIAAFGGVLYRPLPKSTMKRETFGLSRLVTLPDYQGLGLAFVLADYLGSVYSGLGYYFHSYPAHPSLIRGFDKSKNWTMQKKPGVIQNIITTPSSTMKGAFGGRPCGMFRYCGEKMDAVEAKQIMEFWRK